MGNSPNFVIHTVKSVA